MALLFKNLRVHQIFGANTDVGKTILSTALVRAATRRNRAVFYLKPVSTGALEDGDVEHVLRYVGSHERGTLQTDCLYRFQEPVSPHLAARLASKDLTDQVTIPSDNDFVMSIATYIKKSALRCSSGGQMYVETAGGVHSPTLTGTTQAEAYRPLFLPTILVGDPKLGGISSTISSYEALVLRGYIIDAILIFRDEYYRNWEYLEAYFAERNVKVFAVDAPPPKLNSIKETVASTEKYYERLLLSDAPTRVRDILDHLDVSHKSRLAELESMPRRTLDSVWWPFVQHGLLKREEDVTVIDSASSDFFSVYKKPLPSASPDQAERSSLLQSQFDGSASWWTQAVGHAHPRLTLAASCAAGRYGHVMFPEATHLPALTLAESLLHDGPGKGWASRVFFSDDGSTGMEIALKMALRAFCKRDGSDLDRLAKRNLSVIGLKGSYHGDTIGVMDACEEGVFTCEWHGAKGYWFEPPTVSIQDSKPAINIPSAITTKGHIIHADSLSSIYNVNRRLSSPLAGLYRDHIQSTMQRLRNQESHQFAALVLEPLVMGAGGMLFVDPLFQRILVDVVRGSEPFSLSSGCALPVIFDEVFVGLYRIGMKSAAALLGVYPDISVNAKILTGGLVPLAVTLASDVIFKAFLSDSKADALLHGHSYTAHAVGCAVANETLAIIEELRDSPPWKAAQDKWRDSSMSAIWSFWDPVFINEISCLDVVHDVMTLGTVLAINFVDDDEGYGSTKAHTLLQSIKHISPAFSLDPSEFEAAPFGIHFRTLGNVAYFMTSLNTPSRTIQSVQEILLKALSQTNKNVSID